MSFFVNVKFQEIVIPANYFTLDLPFSWKIHHKDPEPFLAKKRENEEKKGKEIKRG